MTIQRIKLRRGTAAAWTSANPTLAAGEPGYETDTGKHKIGNGATAWASLAYVVPTAAALAADSAFTSQFAPIATSLEFPPSQTQNTATGVVTGTTVNNVLYQVSQLPNSVSGQERLVLPARMLDASWIGVPLTMNIVFSSPVSSTGDFRVRASFVTSEGDGSLSTAATEIWTDTLTPAPNEVATLPQLLLTTHTETFTVSSGYIWFSPIITRLQTDVLDTNTGIMFVHSVIVKKA